MRTLEATCPGCFASFEVYFTGSAPMVLECTFCHSPLTEVSGTRGGTVEPDEENQRAVTALQPIQGPMVEPGSQPED